MEDSDSPIQNFPLITPTQWLDTPEVHRTSMAFDLASHALLRARAAVTEHAKAHSTKCEALVKERDDLLSQITVLQESLHHERAARKLEQEAIQMERAAFETWEKKLKEEENSIKSARASLSVDLTRTMQAIQEVATLHDLRPSVMSPPSGPSQCPDPPSPVYRHLAAFLFVSPVCCVLDDDIGGIAVNTKAMLNTVTVQTSRALGTARPPELVAAETYIRRVKVGKETHVPTASSQRASSIMLPSHPSYIPAAADTAYRCATQTHTLLARLGRGSLVSPPYILAPAAA
ncbi:hypothetical protein B0H10DRAFT_2218791 [Mycena sp. CBHHK59/15]|nr:hypothetical protein B0H10DRAFT_2218791 [Mycena sp. CBHHK59/15]